LTGPSLRIPVVAVICRISALSSALAIWGEPEGANEVRWRSG